MVYWIQVGNNNSTKNQLIRRFLFYSAYGWGVPSVIVLVGQILQNVGNFSDYVVTPGFGIETCWFYGKFLNLYIWFLFFFAILFPWRSPVSDSLFVRTNVGHERIQLRHVLLDGCYVLQDKRPTVECHERFPFHAKV